MSHQELTIEKIVAGGMGLGRTADGMVAMVRHVLPGEEVTIRVRQLKKNHLLADLVKVLKESPERVTPRCPLYTSCGGCDFQHMTLEAQHQYKSEVFIETLKRGGERVRNLDDAVFLPLLPSPEPFGYRQRIRLHSDDRGRLGFHRFHSHEVEPVDACPLARPEINKVLGCIRSHASLISLLRQTTAFELLVNPDAGEIVALIHFKRRPRPADLAHGAALRKEAPELGRIFFMVTDHGIFNADGGRAETDELLLSSTLPANENYLAQAFTWEVGGFCQVNQAQNENLIRIVLDWAREEGAGKALDLFCGMGNFSLPLSRIVGSVYGIDGQGAAIRSAKRNAGLAGLANCTFTKKPVADGVRELLDEDRTFPLILIDPPRQGAPDIIKLLPALKPQRIIIVSCNPATLARDLNGLMDEGFVVDRILPVDMFPQTHHLESVTLLTGPDVM